MIRVLYLLFVLSGAAGLIYESIWTRYLGLFVGHDAYAQILVLVIFLGGMSIGAMVVSRRSAKLREPLYGYVAVEFAVGVIGLVFHDGFQATTAFAYEHLYPALADNAMLPLAKWAVASLLILPQSILLGATFPLMSAGVLRLQRKEPGRSLALLYFANSIGAAVGVLVAGFYLVELAGLPGTLLVAAMLNLLVALGTIFVIVRARNTAIEAGTSTERAPVSGTDDATPAAATSPTLAPGRLRQLLLFTAFATAIASFIYEIDWIRMLSLVLGSATHSFELMLSAFILGLALGAFWIRSRADRFQNPLKALGVVQWVMGALALATLPLYAKSFDAIAELVQAFARTDSGYAGFTIARYAICLVIMIPATFCAGMTLPLITRTLLVSGEGERAIGEIYGWNTLGSIIGVVLGGLVLLPLLGLKGMLVAGASLDMAVGVLLVAAVAAQRPVLRRLTLGLLAGGAAYVAAVALATKLEQRVLISGVYRTGTIVKPGDWDVKLYRDGRTATVAAIRTVANNGLSISTNGKPDASLGRTWFEPCDAAHPRRPLEYDAATQTLLPLITLAHAPRASTGAVIGQGSGMSSHLLLGSPAMQRLVTVEIEPRMVEGSRVFYPVNRRVFDDPRSRIVIDDAKSYFASSHQRYDLILSEPSNPWVSGVSGLFTVEFYQRVSRYLAPGGVFGQWMHLYELDDGLATNVLAAIHKVFPSYAVYLVPNSDILIVAGNGPSLPAPDWSVAQFPDLQKDLCHFLPLTPEALDALYLVGRAQLAPLLDGSKQANSDFYPVLDLGAERRRFRHDFARGLAELSSSWFNFASSMGGKPLPPGGATPVPFPENPRLRARYVSAALRASTPSDSQAPSWYREARFRQQLWAAGMRANQAPTDWKIWVQQFVDVERDRSGGTAGWADEPFYAEALDYMKRYGAPEAARDAIQFRRALQTWSFADAATTADRLMPLAIKEGTWITADELRDGAVVAKLHLRDAAGARMYMDSLSKYSARKPDDLRTRLLESYVESLEQSAPRVGTR